MHFPTIIAAFLLGAVAPALAQQAAWCPGAGRQEVQQGCIDNGIKLAKDAGVCCVTTAEERTKMTNVCYYIGKTPQFGGACW
ncbi:unnamed protein product [Cercospora beticola]|nr:unnamed protein product [Cercospora beticola]